MIAEPKQSLQGFVRATVTSSEEWEEWLAIRNSPKPVTRTRPAPLNSGLMFLRETDDASSEYLRREELFGLITRRLREELKEGRWIVSGRLGPPQPRQDLEPFDWETAGIDFDASIIGRFQHVEVREARRLTNREIMQHFIERICDAAGSPGEPMTKDVVERLAGRLYPENFGSGVFDVAWKEANIGDAWHRRGPKKKSESK
jgi:hypothetical protein